MPPSMSVIQINKLLDNSNCGKCGERTCFAFAAAVFRGDKGLGECPQLDPETVARLTGVSVDPRPNEQYQEDDLEKLKSEVTRLDLAAAAERTGGTFNGNKLTLNVLSKEFSVDTNGELSASIHINRYVAIPFLDYILHGKGKAASGKWVSLRELREGREWYPLFRKRCEEPLKQVADSYSSLFDDMVHILGGKQVEEQFQSDISVVLHPLPKVPVMICYWQPDDGLDSGLYFFFDETADENLDIGNIFTLGVGLAQMFRKMAQTHGFEGMLPPA